MAELKSKTFPFTKEQLMNAFEDQITPMGLRKMGNRPSSGLISFKSAKDDIFYAHFVEIEDGSTEMTIAPNLSYIKDRRQSELPEKDINNLFEKFKIALNDLTKEDV